MSHHLSSPAGTSVRTRLAVTAAAGAMTLGGLALTAAQAGAATPTPRCADSALTVSRTFVQHGAGHAWFALIYRNNSSRSCTIAGYPGLDAVAANGHVLAHASRDKAVRARTVTVRPGAYASAQVEWLNANPRTGRTCPLSHSIDTIVPNATRVHHVAVQVGLCQLEVEPTFSGVAGYPYYAQAQHEWLVGAKASSAETDVYLHRAAAQLRKAGSLYTVQIKHLDRLASLPLTSLTPKQKAEAKADLAALDAFFATPKLYS